jgi:predicted metal-dependent HD superfamily phosphohydrolase
VDEAIPDLAERLRSRWSVAFPQCPGIGAILVERYADSSRVYHDLRHLDDVLRHVDTLAEEADDVTAVVLAAWFHDAVYDVRRADNERASADLAAELLTPHVETDRLTEVRRLVLLTQTHAVVVGDSNGAVLCDADLAVLGGTAGAYADYTARVRSEFSFVPDAAFRTGRASVLRRLLALPSLFHSARGRAEWETRARANLAAELAQLSLGRS